MEPIEIIQQENNDLIPEKEVKLDEEFTPPILTPVNTAPGKTPIRMPVRPTENTRRVAPKKTPVPQTIKREQKRGYQ